MFTKRFNIIRYSIILVTALALLGIYIYQSSLNKEEDIKITKDTVIEVAKSYINDNNEYFKEILDEKDLEIRICTKEFVKTGYLESDENFKGYVKIKNNDYEFVESEDFIVDKLYKDDNFYAEPNNEGMPYDINYVFKGEPNNYIMYKDKKYRIVGLTNISTLKLVSVDSETKAKWGTSGNINYFSGKEENKEYSSVKGIFYVGFVRSETNDISQILKNEKRNNTYTKVIPKYYGYESYINVSDIINASNSCKYTRITDINNTNCKSYLLTMLKNTYTSTTGENDYVYYINEAGEVNFKALTENINVYKVIYINGITRYLGGDGSINNPYLIEE